MFFEDAFKTFIHSIAAIDYLGNDSTEVKIKLAKSHTVITVFILQRNNSGSDLYNTRSDNSEVWVGDDDGNFSTTFT